MKAKLDDMGAGLYIQHNFDNMRYCDTNIVCFILESNESMQKLHEGIEDLERGSYYYNNIVKKN